jgi:exodeoxyribonuclease-3
VIVASWNVNSIKARLGNVLSWLEEARPDVVCLQETKCLESDFPGLELKSLGYELACVGQRGYNGVAILSRPRLEDVTAGLPGDPDDKQARWIEATVEGVRIVSLYLPNGNPVGSDKFPYKLAWMDRLIARAKALLALERPVVLAGDYNVCPTDDDVYDPIGFRDDALCRPESRARFRTLLNLGWTDAYRVFDPEPHKYTYWDYQQGRWPRDEGLRIDHLICSPHAADRLLRAWIDKSPRGKERASDHTPILCELA